MTTYPSFGKTKPFRPLVLALLAAILLPVGARSEGSPEAVASGKPANPTPWGFNLTTYLWLPGVDGSFTAGKNSGSVEAGYKALRYKVEPVAAALQQA